MSNKKQQIPDIRFKGFTDDWEQRELGELVSKAIDNRGKTPPTQEKGIYPLLEIASIGGYFPDYSKVSKYVDDDTYNTWFRAHLKENDILFSTVGNTGLATLMDNFEGATVAQNIVGFRAKNSNVPKFLLQMFKLPRNLKKAKRIEMGAVQPSIKVSQLIHVRYQVPTSKKEQIKIGCFFKHLDDTIALHQRQLYYYKELKKATLQKMFPREGEKVPEVRFDGYTGEWEQRKLGGLAFFSKGTGYTKGDLTTAGKPIILYGRLYTKYETIIENVDTFVVEKEKSVISAGNEVIVPASGETSEDISRASVVAKPGIILGGDLNIIKPNTEIDPAFLALTISNGRQQKELSKKAQGKSVVHLHNSDLKEVDLVYPQKEEQSKIGTFFKHLDDAINLHQQKVKDYQKLKEVVLKQAFV